MGFVNAELCWLSELGDLRAHPLGCSCKIRGIDVWKLLTGRYCDLVLFLEQARWRGQEKCLLALLDSVKDCSQHLDAS